MFMIGCIACRREGGDGCAQRGRSVIYDSVVGVQIPSWKWAIWRGKERPIVKYRDTLS